MAAVREVFGEVGADKVPELIVINKADVADPLVVSRLLAREPHAVVVSARTGAGVDDVLAAVERDLPRPAVELEVLLPYERGDLLNKIHEYGEVGSVDHTEDGSRVVARMVQSCGRVGAVHRSADVVASDVLRRHDAEEVRRERQGSHAHKPEPALPWELGGVDDRRGVPPDARQRLRPQHRGGCADRVQRLARRPQADASCGGVGAAAELRTSAPDRDPGVRRTAASVALHQLMRVWSASRRR